MRARAFVQTDLAEDRFLAEYLRHAAEVAGVAREPSGGPGPSATGQPPDHPVHLFCPETRYLTGLLLQAE